MDQIFSILFFGIFLISMFVFMKILLATNLEKIFKQGKIFEIRITYLFLTVILSYLFSNALIELMKAMYNIIIN
ncbi:MAG: DUF1146 domain-containing protein [Bacilli bacterium]|nr:DUF1146 domain-containing protein [Bacilli bacterium]